MVKVSRIRQKIAHKKKGPPVGGVVGRIKAVAERDPYYKVSIYGHSATGKTTFASTAPKPALVIKFEEGTNSVYDVKGLDDVPIYKTEDIRELVESSTILKYKSIIVDTATMLQDMVLKEILGLDTLPVQKGWGLASQQQWQQCTLQTKEYLRAILGLADQRHVLIIAQEREFTSEAGAELIAPYVSSALSPSVMGWLNAACDIIVQCHKRQKIKTKVTMIKGKPVKTKEPTGKIEYCLRTGPHEVFFTKFRVPKTLVLPDEIVDPSFDKLTQALKGE